MENLKDLLQKLPLQLFLVLYLGYLAMGYYDFTNSPDSPLIQKQTEITNVKKENEALRVKIKSANDFLKSLDLKRAEMRKLASTLGEMRGTLNEDLDVPALMKMIVTEAMRVKLNVLGIKPVEAIKRDYYVEQPFILGFKGVYVQLMVFLDRLANVENIVRVDNYELRSVGNTLAPFVELEGTIQISAYKYLGTDADHLGKALSSATPASGSSGGSSGTGTAPSQTETPAPAKGSGT